MSNTFFAHIFKRRSVGERQEVTLKLFHPETKAPWNPPVVPDWALEENPPEAGADSDAMHFRGTWESGTDYAANDVVIESGAMHIALEDVENSTATPTNNASGDHPAFPPSSGYGGGTTYRAVEGTTTYDSATTIKVFFDVSEAGHIVLSSDLPSQYHNVFDTNGDAAGGSPGVNQIAAFDVVPGRYFANCQSSNGQNGTTVTLTLSQGAVVDPGADPSWTKIANLT